MLSVLLILFYFSFPVLIIYLCLKYSWLDKVGAVLINYGFGILIANIGVFPEGVDKLQEILITILIPIAIPLLLFSADMNTWLKLIGKTALTFGVGIIALLISIYAGYYFFVDEIENLSEISGMLVGVYTGGTPNLASIKTALNVPADRFIITHTSDMFASVLLLLFVLMGAQKVLNLILPKFSLDNIKSEDNTVALEIAEDTQEFKGILNKKYHLDILKGLGLSTLVFGIGGALSLLVPENAVMLTVILTITTLAILLSFQARVQKIKKTFQTGMYLIHVFSLIVASMADFSKFDIGESIYIFYYVMFVVFGSFFVHLIIAYFLKVDTDTFIITTIAMVFSPPFIPVVAASLKNKHVIVSGITAGIIGYAIGNYLGIFVAFTLE